MVVEEMTYATELVQRYRLALHHLWNMCFWAPEPFRDYASVDQFNRIKLPLFLSLVVDRLGSDLEEPDHIFGNAFKVVSPVTRPYGGIPSITVELPDRTGIWELRKGPFHANDLQLILLDFSIGTYSTGETSATILWR